jgi:uncharacterized protein YndB with AHSA1/START domain
MSAWEGGSARKLPEERIVHTRLLDAPRDLVFDSFTEPERLMRWWAPNGFTTPACTVDLRPGGVFHYCMRSGEGHDYWGKGIYLEIARPHLIVYTDTFSDAQGRTVPPTVHGLSPDWPLETRVSVAFEEEKGRTRLTLQHEVPSAPPAEIDMCRKGWAEMLDRLAALLEGERRG